MEHENRCVIVGGAEIKKYGRIRSMLRKSDFFVFCDGGLKHLEKLGIGADLIVGDFDSYKNPHSETETIILPCEKDDTDTVYAIKEALRRGYSDFLLIGVIGERLDHTLGNVSALLMLDNRGAEAAAADDYSELSVVSEKYVYIDDSVAYFSLLAVFGDAKGITVRNAKYPLENARIDSEYQYGISNEVIRGKHAEVSVKEGKLLLVKVFDK